MSVAYLGWSGLVYFGSLGQESHAWWPLFLFPLILPWSAIYQFALDPLIGHWLAPDPRTAPVSAWMAMDYIAGGFYIVVGTVWFWFIGKWLAHLLYGRRREPSK